MKSIFLSYSSRDYFFAEMLSIKLEEAKFKIWRDQGSIRAGDDWRQTIEVGIRDCFAVVVALSGNSAESPYVTYEWAYATGMGKPVVPVKLSECKIHPKLEPTQYIDFSYPKALPWQALIQRLQEIDPEQSEPEVAPIKGPTEPPQDLENAANEVLEYLNRRGYTMASFERLRKHMGGGLTDAFFDDLIASRGKTFRRATIKGGKPGIAKRIP
jgi:hypothetical protein